MTQYLLVQARTAPTIPSYSATLAATEESLRTTGMFSTSCPIWVIRPTDGELDEVVAESQIGLDSGLRYAETQLGILLASVVDGCEGMALFMSSYADDLPRANTLETFHGSVEEQLRDELGMGEIYVRWERGWSKNKFE